MDKDLKKYQQAAEQEVAAATSDQALEKIRVLYLGRKGKISLALRKIKDLSPAEKKVVAGFRAG